ncbi:FAD-dependent monooxygenase [Hyphomicrobium sp.]|uniref:FAD-dependent monooxygenase n=1 Tax=Hyphomicrobium sp. TaxID=82 RepID=UPI002E329B6E|nr:FAD-dependent monooxygenase [Hyphomicrobium sp.]HEX2840631.1 FAD-dependent monooxygenase [Hyphomicrobium sp.]
MTQRFDIVISGGSFAGLAFARALTWALGDGIRIAIVDRSPRKETTAPDARAFALSAGARRMLDTLGIWQAISNAAQPVTEIEITDSSLDAGIRPVLLKYDNRLGDEGATDAEPASSIVPAPELEQALYRSVADAPGVTFLTPAEIIRFVDTGPGVSITLRDGSELTASLLVGAEGRRSPSRDEAGIKTIGWRYDQTAIVTTIAHERPHNARAIQHFLPGGPFAILPLPGNRSCLTWTEDAGEATRILALDDATFLAEVETRVAGRLGALEVVGPRQSWPLEMHLARAYIAPRFAILGDAAHGVHPIAGQGVNLAFRDVAALSEIVVDTMRVGLDPGNLESLGRYERWRRFDSALSAAAFDGLNRLFSNDQMLVRAARDFGLGLVDRLPGLKRRFVSEAAGLTGDLPRLFKSEQL